MPVPLPAEALGVVGDQGAPAQVLRERDQVGGVARDHTLAVRGTEALADDRQGRGGLREIGQRALLGGYLDGLVDLTLGNDLVELLFQP